MPGMRETLSSCTFNAAPESLTSYQCTYQWYQCTECQFKRRRIKTTGWSWRPRYRGNMYAPPSKHILIWILPLNAVSIFVSGASTPDVLLHRRPALYRMVLPLRRQVLNTHSIIWCSPPPTCSNLLDYFCKNVLSTKYATHVSPSWTSSSR